MAYPGGQTADRQSIEARKTLKSLTDTPYKFIELIIVCLIPAFWILGCPSKGK